MAKKFKGIDFLVHIGEEVLGGQRGCKLNRSAETIDVTAKDSDGWQENLSGLKNWGVDTDGLIIEDDKAYSSLEDAFMNNTEVDVVIVTPMKKKYVGKAFVTDFPIDAPYDDAVTYSVSFTGTGALEKADITEQANAEITEEEQKEVA